MKQEPDQWKAQYEQTGYLVVEDVLDAPMLQTLRGEMEKITANPGSFPAHLQQWVDYERNYVKHRPQQSELTSDQVGDAIRNIMELPRFSPAFAQLIPHPPLLDILEALFGSTEFGFHNYKCIIKAPRVSSRFVWHRDLPYLQHTSPNLITAMLCLDDMTEANGATVVLPGTHRIPHEQVRDSDTDIAEDQLPDAPRTMVTCRAGSAVLFHVNIIHGGGANRSDQPRRNIIGIWAGPDALPATPARYIYQDVKPRSADPVRQKQMRMTFGKST